MSSTRAAPVSGRCTMARKLRPHLELPWQGAPPPPPPPPTPPPPPHPSPSPLTSLTGGPVAPSPWSLPLSVRPAGDCGGRSGVWLRLRHGETCRQGGEGVGGGGEVLITLLHSGPGTTASLPRFWASPGRPRLSLRLWSRAAQPKAARPPQWRAGGRRCGIAVVARIFITRSTHWTY